MKRHPYQRLLTAALLITIALGSGMNLTGCMSLLDLAATKKFNGVCQRPNVDCGDRTTFDMDMGLLEAMGNDSANSQPDPVRGQPYRVCPSGTQRVCLHSRGCSCEVIRP